MDFETTLDAADAVAEHNSKDLMKVLTTIGAERLVQCIRPVIHLIKEVKQGKDLITAIEEEGTDVIQMLNIIGWGPLIEIIPNFTAIGRTLASVELQAEQKKGQRQ